MKQNVWDKYKMFIIPGVAILIVLIGVVFISGCTGTSGKTVDIFWEHVKVQVKEVAEVPADLGLSDDHVVRYEVFGEPQDHFRGYDSLTLMEIYTEDGQRCGSLRPIQGGQADVLVQGKITVIATTNCRTRTPEKLQFIFKDASVEGLDTIADKFYIKVSGTISEDSMNALKEFARTRPNQTAGPVITSQII